MDGFRSKMRPRFGGSGAALRRKWGTVPNEVGRRYDASGALFRTKWGAPLRNRSEHFWRRWFCETVAGSWRRVPRLQPAPFHFLHSAPYMVPIAGGNLGLSNLLDQGRKVGQAGDGLPRLTIQHGYVLPGASQPDGPAYFVQRHLAPIEVQRQLSSAAVKSERTHAGFRKAARTCLTNSAAGAAAAPPTCFSYGQNRSRISTAPEPPSHT